MTAPAAAAHRYLAIGAVLVGGMLALPVGLGRDVVYALIAVSAPLAIAAGIRRWRPERAVAWWLVVLAAASWSVGELWWIYQVDVAQVDGDGTGADVFYMLAYPLLAAALFHMGRGRRERGELAGLLDAASVTLVVALVLGVFVIDPVWTDLGAGLTDKLVASAYPLGDLLVVLQLAYLWTYRTRTTPAFHLLGAATLLIGVADVAYQVTAFLPVLAWLEPWLDGPWVLGYLALGAAGLHPSMRHLTDHRRPARGAFTLSRVVVLGAAFAVLPGLSLVLWALGRPQPTLAVEVVHALLVVLVVVRLSEVVATIRSQQARLVHLADTDALTGLDNRRRFTERLTDHLDRETGPVGRAAVLMVGLERFVEVNDTLGYRTGDELLRTVGSVLTGLVGTRGAVARVGGDVFGLLVPEVDEGAALGLAHRLRAVLVEPLSVGGMSITVDGAVGVVLLPEDGDDAEQVLTRADVALAAARAAAIGVARFSREAEERGGSAPALMAELKSALDTGDVVVHFQPQVSVATGHVIGAEALVRWQHPVRGLIAAADFVPAAERTGLIRLLTLVVLDRAVAQGARWLDDGQDLTVAVNLSVRNLLDPRLVDDVRSSLERHGLPAVRLELEITETMAMVDPVRAAAVLSELADLGVVLSVDDYGTGYGSLAYLQRLPVHRLKIDRSFVTGLLDDPASAAIVRSTVDLARHLQLSVVAEGVEDLDTLLALQEMHCSAAQGFGLSRPVPADRLPEVLARIERTLPAALGGVEVPSPRVPGGLPASGRQA